MHILCFLLGHKDPTPEQFAAQHPHRVEDAGGQDIYVAEGQCQRCGKHGYYVYTGGGEVEEISEERYRKLAEPLD